MKCHFSNYLSRKEALECSRRGVKKIILTPTALKQTPKKTLDTLREEGIKIVVRGQRGRPRKLSHGGVKRVLAMRQRGLSYYRISRLTGIPRSTVFDYCRHYDEVFLPEEEVNKQELLEAKSFLQKLKKAGLCEELTSLAAQGCAASSPEQIAYILGEIEKVMETYR